MTDQTADDRLDEYGEDVELEAKPRKAGLSGKKLTLFVILPLVLLLGVGAGLYLTGTLDGLLGKSAAEDKNGAVSKSVFYEVPTMLVNLNSSGRQSNFLKLSISLELGDKSDLERLERMMPRVVDSFQVYLRELRLEDLQGSAGLQRLREELLLRVNTSIEGVEVRDVLFKEMLVQ